MQKFFSRGRPIGTSILVIFSLLWALNVGCKAYKPVEPWQFDSPNAPYSLMMPGNWQRIDATEINEHADFAASRDNKFFLMVIAQQLPEYPVPDAQLIQEMSISRMKEQLDDFVLDRQGPIELNKHEGITVFFHGSMQELPIQYIATYITENQWGYQIIAWSPKELEQDLIAEIDTLLSQWYFHSTLHNDSSLVIN